MEILIGLVVCSLAAFRISEMLVLDDGPFEIFISLRGWFAAAPDGSHLRRTISDGLACVHCVGVWAAFPLALFMAPANLIEFVLYWLAIAGLQSVIAGNLGRIK